ncbi:hypothetical protein RSEGYP2_11 [Ralstonia phage RsoP1EGY]|uniref:Uncharacterized protein n=1 Tax=Ralstonia phage RsoP1EGY TaxID=2070026 RepID=A0A2R2ZGD4_9CAUD|nr:hypothetical protein HOT00_gp10 [Ralstonia phage RsoP1EGY]AUO78163.1 hypothetical protein RSEGYP2_11 [Ralstonia phage RsoP1EGY]
MSGPPEVVQVEFRRALFGFLEGETSDHHHDIGGVPVVLHLPAYSVHKLHTERPCVRARVKVSVHVVLQ